MMQVQACSALGEKFFDSQGQRLKGCGKDLKSIAQIDKICHLLCPKHENQEFIVACDVNTPFAGLMEQHMFCSPKTDPQMVKALDDGMYSFAKYSKQ